MEAKETTSEVMSLLNKGKLFFKTVVIFIMALVLWVPTNFIMSLVKERAGRQQEAIADISNKWAGKQVITGPIVMLPYYVYSENGKGGTLVSKAVGYFLPDKSDISAKVFPEKRHRGIYQVIVYRSEISIRGKFKPLDLSQLKIAPDKIIWNEAALLFKVQDNLRGINEDLFVKWNDSSFIFNPQLPGQSTMTDAFSAAVPLTAEDAVKEHPFVIYFLLLLLQMPIAQNHSEKTSIQMNVL